MMALIPQIFIFSVFRATESKDSNIKNHASVMAFLEENGFGPVELIGRYNGVDEKSILIEGQKSLATVKELAALYNQESFLQSDTIRRTDLVDVKTGKANFIGTLQAVSEAEAMTSKNFTYNPYTKTYYMVK